jgi:hypothetical protein
MQIEIFMFMNVNSHKVFIAASFHLQAMEDFMVFDQV